MDRGNWRDLNGDRHGVWEASDHNNHTLLISYVHGLRHGLYRFLPWGELKEEGFYRNNRRQGPWIINDKRLSILFRWNSKMLDIIRLG